MECKHQSKIQHPKSDPPGLSSHFVIRTTVLVFADAMIRFEVMVLAPVFQLLIRGEKNGTGFD